MKHEEGKKREWDGNNEWDPITMTTDGGVIWHNYADPRRIVVTFGNETPQQAAARYQPPATSRGHGSGSGHGAKREGNMEHPEEKPDAKFRRIAHEIVANKDWRKLLAGEHDDEMNALDDIAKHYGGESMNTGGNVHVAVIPLGPHDCMGVSAEVVCRYTNSKATSMEDVFWEPENDISEGCISLVGTTCACGAPMVDGVCSNPECRSNVQG